MEKKVVQYSITFFFLGLFLTLKIAGLHSFTHHGNDDDHAKPCDVCDMVVANQCLPLSSCKSEEITFDIGECFIPKTKPNVCSSILVNRISINLLFSRPPPFFS